MRDFFREYIHIQAVTTRFNIWIFTFPNTQQNFSQSVNFTAVGIVEAAYVNVPEIVVCGDWIEDNARTLFV